MTNLPAGTRVRLLENHPHENATGVIENAKNVSMNALIRLDYGGSCYAQENQMTALPVAEEGDLVRISTRTGRWAAQEGHVIKIGPNGVTVDVGYTEAPTFHPSDLEVIEKFPRKRVIGKPIHAKDVKVGDKISVTVKERTNPDIEKVSTITALVGKIIPQKNGNIDFQTSSGSVIFYSDGGAAEIILLESIEEDPIYRDLTSMGPGSVIVFANKPGEPETDMAIKQHWEDTWHLVDGSKNRKPRTVGLINIIKKKGVSYSVIRRFEQKED